MERKENLKFSTDTGDETDTLSEDKKPVKKFIEKYTRAKDYEYSKLFRYSGDPTDSFEGFRGESEGSEYDTFYGNQIQYPGEDLYTDYNPSFRGRSESIHSSGGLSSVYSQLSPFTVHWSFGIKKNVKLINLTKKNSFKVFYVSSHFGVIYNYKKNIMTFLPGHNFPITSISSDVSGRWLVSADAGEDTVIIIWDIWKKLPAWCLYNVFPKEGTSCVKISQDARFLAAINCNFNFSVKFWKWTLGREQPDGELKINPEFGKAKSINFNQLNTEEFMVTMESQVIFCKWSDTEKNLLTYIPAFEYSKKIYGVLRESVFLDDNHTAITSTSRGHLVAWCDVKFTVPIREDVPGTIEKKFLKAVKIHETGITSLRLSDKIIMTSSEDGSILFHDQHLRLVYLLPQYKLDPLVSADYNIEDVPCDSDPFSANFHRFAKPESYDNIDHTFTSSSSSEQDNYPNTSEQNSSTCSINQKQNEGFLPQRDPSDCTVNMRPIAIRDFMFLTTSGRIGYVCHRRIKVKYYLYESESPIVALDCNPKRNHLAVGNALGRLVLYQYTDKTLLLSQTFQEGISTLKYSFLGHSLMLGTLNGNVIELDPLILTVRSVMENGKTPIKQICFSPRDDTVAYYDQNSTVYVHVKKKQTNKWIFMGKYISHFKPIRDLMFEETQEGSKCARLFSIGEDRMLVEYDTKNFQENKLKLLNITRIEQTAIPLCFIWLRNIYKNPQFIISNNEYKLKIVDSFTQVCQKTTLGPTADTPINFMRVVSDSKDSKDSKHKLKMIYATEKHIGIRILPPTGNPFEGMGMVAHPEKIISFAVSYDNKYAFTSGVNDFTILMWTINSNSVEVSKQLGGSGLEPYVSLIEEGSNSFLFKEIEDFFYYAQIIHQGEDPNTGRSVSKNLALCEIPDLYRSLGYYPTEHEVNNILYELEHLTYETTGQITTEVSFDECVKAYLNHRPVINITLDVINKALLVIADTADPTDIILERNELYKALEEKAECMEHAEVVGYLCILLLPKDETNPIPRTLPLSEFANNVLGIDLTISEQNVRQITHAFEFKNNTI